MKEIVEFKSIDGKGIEPVKSSKGSSAYDVIMPNDVKIKYGRQKIRLYVALQMPEHISCDMRSRSGYTTKGMLTYNHNGKECRIDADVKLGLIDNDYIGEIGATVICRDKYVKKHPVYLRKGQHLGQIKFNFDPDIELVETTDELKETERGTRGFGEMDNE